MQENYKNLPQRHGDTEGKKQGKGIGKGKDFSLSLPIPLPALYSVTSVADYVFIPYFAVESGFFSPIPSISLNFSSSSFAAP